MEQLRPYKFLVMPILQAVVDDVVIGERQPEQPDAVFGVDALRRYADGFEAAVAQQNEQALAAFAAQAMQALGANGTEPKEKDRMPADPQQKGS